MLVGWVVEVEEAVEVTVVTVPRVVMVQGTTSTVMGLEQPLEVVVPQTRSPVPTLTVM
jgi:hypothetical protein